jgi:hypothetical protein
MENIKFLSSLPSRFNLVVDTGQRADVHSSLAFSAMPTSLTKIIKVRIDGLKRNGSICVFANFVDINQVYVDRKPAVSVRGSEELEL